MATDSRNSGWLEGKQKPNHYEVELEMLTWNIAGKYSGKYFAALRGIVVPTVKQQLGDECISFLQEISSPSAVSKWGFPNFTTSVFRGKREAGVSIPSTTSKGQVNLMPNGLITIEYLKGVCHVPEEYAERLYGQMVRISLPYPTLSSYINIIYEQYYSSDVTLLSYHAPYKTEERKKKTKRFFEEMLKLADRLNQTIIIGGDFNLPILDVKTQVKRLEASGYQGRILVALYMPTQRRSDNCIDTFAIVHPTSPEHRTECEFGTTIPIYPFPVSTYKWQAPVPLVHPLTPAWPTMANDQKQTSVLRAYPSFPTLTWFKLINYGKERDDIERTLKDKQESIREELRKCEEEETRDEEEIESLTEKLEDSEEWLTQPYVEEYKKVKPFLMQSYLPQDLPVPLWPYSPLHQVLDHDPVVTTLRIKLRPCRIWTSSTGYGGGHLHQQSSASSLPRLPPGTAYPVNYPTISPHLLNPPQTRSISEGLF